MSPAWSRLTSALSGPGVMVVAQVRDLQACSDGSRRRHSQRPVRDQPVVLPPSPLAFGGRTCGGACRGRPAWGRLYRAAVSHRRDDRSGATRRCRRATDRRSILGPRDRPSREAGDPLLIHGSRLMPCDSHGPGPDGRARTRLHGAGSHGYLPSAWHALRCVRSVKR